MDEETKKQLTDLIYRILNILYQGDADCGNGGPPLYFLSSGKEGDKQLIGIAETIDNFVRKVY